MRACLTVVKDTSLSDKTPTRVFLLSVALLFKVILGIGHNVLLSSKVRAQEKNQNHQSPILFPSSGRWYSRGGEEH